MSGGNANKHKLKYYCYLHSSLRIWSDGSFLGSAVICCIHHNGEGSSKLNNQNYFILFYFNKITITLT